MLIMVGCITLTLIFRFDLAALSKKPILAAAACIVLANRRTNEFLDNQTIAQAEATAGKAVLEAIAAFPLEAKVRFAQLPRTDAAKLLMNDPSCCWHPDYKQPAAA